MAITGFLSLDKIFQPTGQFREKLFPILDPNALIYIPYPRVNCLKTIPFTAAHTSIAHPSKQIIYRNDPLGAPVVNPFGQALRALALTCDDLLSL